MGMLAGVYVYIQNNTNNKITKVRISKRKTSTLLQPTKYRNSQY